MDHIIHFGSRADDRIMADTTVDRASGANLNMVANDHAPATGHFFIPYIAVLFGIIVECIAADNGAGLDDHMIANDHMVHDRHIRIDHAVLSDLHMIADEHGRIDIRSFADRCAVAYGFTGPGERAEVFGDLAIRIKRFVNDQQGFAFRESGFLVDDDITRRAVDTLVVVLGMINKYQVARFHFVNLINAGCLCVRVSQEPGTDQIGDPLQGNGRRKLHIGNFDKGTALCLFGVQTDDKRVYRHHFF